MNRKQWRLLGLTLIASLLMNACGVAPPPATPVDGSDLAVQSNLGRNIELTRNLLNPDVSGRVELWHFWGSPVRSTALRRLVLLCSEQLPNIEIVETFKPWNEIWTENMMAVSAGRGMADIIVEDRPRLVQRAQDGIATNLQPYIDQDNFNMALFWPFTWNETLYEGESYGIPFETDIRTLIWNKNAFREAGLDPERPPETWQDLEEYADWLDIKDLEGNFRRIGFFPLWSASAEYWARTNDWNQVVDGRPNYNDPRFIETLAWIKGWIDRYGGWQKLQEFRAGYGTPPDDLFMSGAVPMFVDTAGYLSQLNFHRPQTRRGERLEWGVSFLPYQISKGNWSGGFALSIPSGAANPEAAWEVIKCITGPAGQISWSRDTFAIPTNREVATDWILMADPYWEAIMEVMKDSQGSTYVPQYPTFYQEMNMRLEQVWLGELTPEEAAQQAQEAIERVMGEVMNKE
jgi:multiple sugar transport system substrate-binding protein